MLNEERLASIAAYDKRTAELVRRIIADGQAVTAYVARPQCDSLAQHDWNLVIICASATEESRHAIKARLVGNGSSLPESRIAVISRRSDTGQVVKDILPLGRERRFAHMTAAPV